MKPRSLRPRTLAAAVAALVAAAGATTNNSYARSPVLVDDAAPAGREAIGISPAQTTARYIVRFVEAPVAQYNSVAASRPVNGIGAIPMKMTQNGRIRLDVHSAQAVNYAQYLKQQQQKHINDNADICSPMYLMCVYIYQPQCC